ncbi:AAA family ATPase, partial [Hymenobacter defluvii]
MLIKNIQISNFLCYYGENRFDFVEGLNIVLGANGYGKSKLYDAFQWIFHNGITDSSPQAAGLRSTRLAKGELISEKAQAECAQESTVKAKVALEVVDNRGKGYQLVRSYIIRRGQDKWHYPDDSAFEILSREVTHFKPVPDSQHAAILEALIPTDVRPYVWFQGERGINNLIDTSSEDSLRQVIKRLSNIDRWDSYIKVSTKAFESAQSAFDTALKKSNRNQNKINDLQIERSSLEKEVKQLTEYIDQISNNLNAASVKHEAFKVGIEYAEKIKELENTLKSQKAHYESVSRKLDAQTDGLTENLFTNYWALLGTANWTDLFEEKIGAYNQQVAEQKALENISRKIEERIQTRLPQGIP